MVGLVVFGGAILYATNWTSRTVVETMLHGEAIDVTRAWMARADWELDELREAFAKRSGRAIADENLPKTTADDPVYRFELYDRDGALIFSSGRSDLAAAAPSIDTLLGRSGSRQGNAEDMVSVLHDGSVRRGDQRDSTRYASVSIPQYTSGRRTGTILAYVDQTRQARLLTESLDFVTAVTAGLIVLAILVPSVLVLVRMRDRWEAQARIRYLSDNDKLTGLANRVSFDRQLERAIARRKDPEEHLAVVAINLDRFKHVNETLGHAAGDVVLRGAAERLGAAIGPGDLAARLGSDEFMVALTQIADPDEIVEFLHRLEEDLARPYRIAGRDVACATSMGAALAPADGNDAATLLRHADLALDRAKQDRRNAFQFFDREMDMAFLRRRERADDLRRAVEQQDFNLVYQPQIRLADGALAGHEALVRWQHPEHGNISPAYFISIAEETELIVPLGEWILRQACRDAMSWPEPRNVAVNLSPVQFKRTNLSDLVANVLDETGLAPDRLELEITETLLMGDTEAVCGQLTELRDLGVQIAMDDFGTGYSSLSYLSRFPFGKIKIDRSFVWALDQDESVSAILCCIVALGRSLGMSVTAEGVETEEQAETVRRLGCDLAQGYFYGRPVSAAESAAFIARSKPTRLRDRSCAA